MACETLLRVSLGLMLLTHAALKVFAFTVADVVGYTGSLDLPAVLAYAVLALDDEPASGKGTLECRYDLPQHPTLHRWRLARCR